MRTLENCYLFEVKVGDIWQRVHIEQIEEGDEVRRLDHKGNVHIEFVVDYEPYLKIRGDSHNGKPVHVAHHHV